MTTKEWNVLTSAMEYMSNKLKTHRIVKREYEMEYEIVEINYVLHPQRYEIQYTSGVITSPYFEEKSIEFKKSTSFKEVEDFLRTFEEVNKPVYVFEDFLKRLQ